MGRHQDAVADFTSALSGSGIDLAEGRDVNVKIRRHAVWSIGALGGPGAAQRLRELAAADQPTDIRAALEHATCLLALRGVSPDAAPLTRPAS